MTVINPGDLIAAIVTIIALIFLLAEVWEGGSRG